MNSKKILSFQDILKRRQRSEFVGRDKQLIRFRENLRYPVDDEHRHFIFHIYGQGGVGKTTLLSRFHRIAEETGFVVVTTDENDEDIPQVLNHFARQLDALGYTLEAFSERYKTYLELQEKI